MQGAVPIRVQLGPFEFDLKTGDLSKGRRKLRLQEQPFQILLMLVERSGELVTREDIKKKLWPNDTVVEFDHSIHAAINRLRQALEDSADSPRYVETVARRGYRLMVPVECLESTPADGAARDEIPSSNDVDAATSLGAPAGLTGRTVSHYRVLDIIGGGGMGVVYRAEDLKLGRAVALKFLPEELGSNPQALERFSREARAASSLDHPNICSIFEFGEHEGRPFIVMQLLEGQTLRDRLAAAGPGERIGLDELLNIGVQVADGLKAAHERGIIHRDIKPANIFLTTKGVAKILDFGLVKLLETGEHDELEAKPDDPPAAVPKSKASSIGLTLTRTGVAMGTAGYMSPEQVRSEKLDARTDLFSFGLVLYEMATGQRAFSGETAAIVHDAILNRIPAPVRVLNSALPARLVSVIDKALEKDKEERYQSAAEMHADLQPENPEARPMAADPSPRRRWKVLTIVTVMIVLAVVASGLYWKLRHKTATRLTARDTIVVADFANSTGDTIFDGTLKMALGIDLQQSPSLNVLSQRKVGETLKLMNRSRAETLTPDLARQVCLRTLSKALLRGSVSDMGNQYVIALAVVDCQTGDTLASTTVEAEHRDRVIHALGEAATRLRINLGDSSATQDKFNRPLELEATPSLDALQAYMEGLNASGPSESLPHFERAVDLDPNFALVYSDLASDNIAIGRPSLATQDFEKAYGLRDRLSLRRRLGVEAGYYMGVTGELEKAIQAHTDLIRDFPESPGLGQLEYILRLVGRNEQAVAVGKESIQFDREGFNSNANIMLSYMALDRPAEAQAAFDETRARNLDGEELRIIRYWLAFLQRDQEAMQEQFTWAMGKPGVEDWLLSSQSDTEAYFGRFRKARELSQRAVDSAKHATGEETAAGWRVNEAFREVALGNTALARQMATEALALSSGRDVEIAVAQTLAQAGDLVQAHQLADKVNREFPLNTIVQFYSLPAIRAAIELQKKNPTNAITLLQTVTPYEMGVASVGNLYPAYLRGLAYQQAGMPQRAAAEFQKVLDHPGVVTNFIIGALAHLQLARAQMTMGDKAAAHKSYQDFLTLWKDADPDIPIYQQAKAEYARLQ
jgi:serine/threonine protein kinase